MATAINSVLSPNPTVTPPDSPSNTPDPASNSSQATLDYQAGKIAFERGDYRQSVQRLQQACALVDPASNQGGEMQIWLVTAYEALGERSQALDLCRLLTRHPDYQTRSQSKRLLYILEAPQLKMRPEWLTQIPDLTNLEVGDGKGGRASRFTSTAPRRPPKPQPFTLPAPPDPNQVNTRDNQFVWVALGLAALVLGGLVWFN